MMHHESFSFSALLTVAESFFPSLMNHQTNHEDALQVIRMVHWQTLGRPLSEAAQLMKKELLELERALGLRFQNSDAVA